MTDMWLGAHGSIINERNLPESGSAAAPLHCAQTRWLVPPAPESQRVTALTPSSALEPPLGASTSREWARCGVWGLGRESWVVGPCRAVQGLRGEGPRCPGFPAPVGAPEGAGGSLQTGSLPAEDSSLAPARAFL